jgi:2-hydroxychromene-2-carboxylate isomerase
MTEVVATPVGQAAEPGTADFWFDPTCPYTWRTSRWLVHVADQRNLTVTWHVMSLSVLHAGDVAAGADDGTPGSDPPEGAVALRALVAAEDIGGQEALAKLYTLLGSRKHDSGQQMTVESVRQAVLDAGLPEAVAAATEDDSLDSRIVESHTRGQERGGMEMGSPVLVLGSSRGYFGPVLTATPTGDDALRLFDALHLLVSVPAFSEIKTSKSYGPRVRTGR